MGGVSGAKCPGEGRGGSEGVRIFIEKFTSQLIGAFDL